MGQMSSILETWRGKSSLQSEWMWHWKVLMNPPLTFAIIGAPKGYTSKAGAKRSAKNAMSRLGFIIEKDEVT